MLSLSLKVASPPPIPPRSRARSASTSSAHSSSEDGPRRRTTRPRPQPLGLPEVEEPCLDAELLCNPPTYSTAAYPTQAVTYRFAQTGPFALTLEAEGKENALLPWRYHIAVGVNVLTLKSWMTSVRRGGEEGMLVAEIESAISSGSATVTMGDRSRSSKDVLSRTVGSKMYYVGNGTSIRWNLGETRWEAFFDSVELATFDPGPARKMFVQPVAHRFFDHLVVAVLLLMREKEETGGCGTDAGPVPPSRL
ncbi:hypothetical protein BD414DRAFT_420017 [Trametes punicea]|nr:hypothetical protein BD414DRAFT_420017 [Trametes punicea]